MSAQRLASCALRQRAQAGTPDSACSTFQLDGKTALMFAVEGGFMELCELLLEKEANPNLANKVL
eukprot:3264461-Rhodomonas_salina.1